MSEEWVPFQERLAKGAKRSIPRGVRFVLLELSLEARSKSGVIHLPLEWSTEKAVHDLLGGNRREIVAALKVFTKPDEDGVAPIEIVRDPTRHRLVVSKWAVWAGPKSSTQRVREMRARNNNGQLSADETLPPVASCNGETLYSTEQDKTEQEMTSPHPPQGGRVSLLERLAIAFADGIAAGAGQPWSMPDANVEASFILTGLQTYKPQLRRDDEIAAWVKRSAATYRRMMGDVAEFQKGFRPSKWLEWLNAGGEKMQRRIKGTPPEQPELLATRHDQQSATIPLSDEEITRRRQKLDAANAALEARASGMKP